MTDSVSWPKVRRRSRAAHRRAVAETVAGTTMGVVVVGDNAVVGGATGEAACEGPLGPVNLPIEFGGADERPGVVAVASSAVMQNSTTSSPPPTAPPQFRSCTRPMMPHGRLGGCYPQGEESLTLPGVSTKQEPLQRHPELYRLGLIESGRQTGRPPCRVRGTPMR